MKLAQSTPMLAVDPAFPQRDVLLDEGVMKDYLARLIAREGKFGVEDCERLRTKYRVGASLRVLYELSGFGETYRIAARVFPRSSRARKAPASAREIHAAELNSTFWIFPEDRKIKNLSVLEKIPAELQEIEGRRWVGSRVAGHAPEKSVTAQCVGENDEVLAYAKIYAGDEGRQVFDTYAHLEKSLAKTSGNLHVSRAIAYSEVHHLLLLEAVSGLSLAAMRRTQRETAFFRLGKALKMLHRIPPPASLPRSTRFNPEALTQTAATISLARPDVAALVERLAHQLRARHKTLGAGETVFLHGDLHPKNILLDGERLWMLDLDQAMAGPAAVDLGSVIAGFYCDACTGSLTWPQASALRRAFLAGYGRLAERTTRESLRWHTAAALLHERALRAVTRIRTAVLQKLPELLLAAEAVLNGELGED